MGVRGLLTYLRYHCPKARNSVSVPDIIYDETLLTGIRPVIAVDAPSCYSLWCEGVDWTIGLEVKEIISRLRAFVESFQAMGADLVFFVGGLTPLKKRKTWLRRRIEGMTRMMEVHDLLYAGQTYEDIPKDLSSIPPNMGNFVAFVLKHVLNCKVFQTVRECDDELIEYVRDNNCFAIFAYDTDFIVSQLNCKVLGADTYDSTTKTTFMYDRVELCNYLNLAVHQLPLLAILASNDIIEYESVKPFHHRICGVPETEHIPYKKLMETIAVYINSLPQPLTSKVFRKICVDVFNDVEQVQLMMRGYYAYTPHPCGDYYTGPDNWNCTMRMAKVRFQQQVLLPPSAWGVMNKMVYESSVCLEDFRKIDSHNEDVKLLPSATITRDLRKRFYGILLFEKRNTLPIVREWCAENTESYVKTVKVKPEYPAVHHPGLRALWNLKKKDSYLKIKWKLFLGAVSPTINNVEEWMSLPADLVASTAVCYYLHRVKYYLTKNESKAVLLTLAMVSDSKTVDLESLRKKKRMVRNFRAAQINITFSRTFSVVFAVMASLGFPVKLSTETAHIKFEPLLFHLLYKNVMDNPSNVDVMCGDNLKVLKNFQKMEDIMFDGQLIM